MTASVIKPDLFLSTKIAIVAFFVPILFANAGVAEARHLTTFEQYAAMSHDQQRAVRTYVFKVVYSDALKRNDRKEYECLDRTYISGPTKAVKLAHARLQADLELAEKNPNPKGRVEYLAAHHFREVCPPARTATN